MVYLYVEYQQLDRQLDNLDEALTVLEDRRDKLHEDMVKLLKEAKQSREEQEKELKNEKEEAEK